MSFDCANFHIDFQGKLYTLDFMNLIKTFKELQNFQEKIHSAKQPSKNACMKFLSMMVQ